MDLTHVCTMLLIALTPAFSLAAEPARFAIGGQHYVFRADENLLALDLDGEQLPLLQGVGPEWQADGAARLSSEAPVRLVDTRPDADTVTCRYEATEDGLTWQTTLRPGTTHDLCLELTSDDPRITHARPGLVVAGGPWTGLDLSQYQLAHGQTNWPKTYYLRDHDLFLCAWWEWETSRAGSFDWPTDACEPRQGTDPFAPAAAMVYTSGPDGKHAPLRDTLHLRVAKRLWDAALPALCRPSEYRETLAEMVYLDEWGTQPASHQKHMLEVLERLVVPHGVRLLTVVQNWQTCGFDSLLPDSIWLPDYPPNPAVGAVAELEEVADLGRRLGLIAFRTNYMLLRRRSPSFQRGLVDFALGPDGKPKWHTQPSRWPDLVRRQEPEIARLWRPNAGFTDQLTSGGYSAAYLDFNRDAGGDGTLKTALQRQREMARLIKDTHRGPLGSETLNQQDLMGYYVDFADFGIMGGHDRLFPPDYKLRRLQEITVNYGCGLCYRFFELPPFKRFHQGRLDIWADPSWMDDYRCSEVMLGNGGYIMWHAPWSWALTECLLIGRLQRHYALAPVDSVEYRVGDGWQSLEELVKGGAIVQTRPWNQKQREFGQVRVRYGHGLTVICNRLPDDLTIEAAAQSLVLPQYGWAAWKKDASIVAYSAYWPGTRDRVECLDEGEGALRFLNPRGAVIEGSSDLRLWKNGRLLWRVDPDTEIATIGDARLSLRPPQPEPLADLQFDFRRGLHGWQPRAGVLRVDQTPDGAGLTIRDPDPQLYSPPLALDGKPGDVVEFTMSTDAGEMGQLYFTTPDDGISQRQAVRFPVQPDGRPRPIAIPVGNHDRWAGHTITQIRLDPIHGPDSATVILHTLRLKRP